MQDALLKELASSNKMAKTKKRIIAHLVDNGPSTITDLAKSLNCSIPTITKFVAELTEADCIRDYGKLETLGGRYPLLYGLKAESGYFLGVDVKHDSISLGIVDFVGDVKQVFHSIPFQLENTPEALGELCNVILAKLKEAKFKVKDILNVNVNLPGRINPQAGLSHTLFNFNPGQSMAETLSTALGMPVTIDNDTRGMTYGEFTQGVVSSQENASNTDILYLNISWGIGLGIVLGGEIYTGKSGFSGELGHITTYDNQLLCHCGKKGCLETEVSGLALHRQILERINSGESSVLSERVHRGEGITQADIIQAAIDEDILVLELLGDMGAKLGKQIAGLINIFNPDLVIIGGTLSQTGDYITQAVQSVVRTYSLNLVNKDTQIVTATLGERAGVIGACMLARSRRFS